MKLFSIPRSSLILRALLVGASVALSAFNASATTAAPSEISPADATALQGFKLDEGFLTKWKAMQKGASKDPCHLDVLFALQDQDDDEDDDSSTKSAHPKARPSLDQSVARYEAQPGAKALLTKNDLTAREYILGVFTLFASAMQQMVDEHPDMVAKGYVQADSSVHVSARNMVFYRAHKDEIHGFMQNLGTENLKRNGGKLPPCAQ